VLSQGVRIMFTKTGKLKYISHLDLCRTFRSAFKRARIPIWYSQGFNPHPKMVFATTVSVGSESLCELLDIRITEPMEEEEFISRLQGALTDDIKILRAYEGKRKFTELRYAEYEITLEGRVEGEELARALSEPMLILRRTKSGERQDDVSKLVRSARVDEQGRIRGVFSALQSEFLSPDNFVKGLEISLGRELCPLKIIRLGVFDENMEAFE